VTKQEISDDQEQILQGLHVMIEVSKKEVEAIIRGDQQEEGCLDRHKQHQRSAKKY
jgi:hypothetical protein